MTTFDPFFIWSLIVLFRASVTPLSKSQLHTTRRRFYFLTTQPTIWTLRKVCYEFSANFDDDFNDSHHGDHVPTSKLLTTYYSENISWGAFLEDREDGVLGVKASNTIHVPNKSTGWLVTQAHSNRPVTFFLVIVKAFTRVGLDQWNWPRLG